MNEASSCSTTLSSICHSNSLEKLHASQSTKSLNDTQITFFEI